MPILKPAIVLLGAPQQHKQNSRKGKKAWRKNIDVSDIQEGLEVVRDEVIKGYKFSSIRCRTITMTHCIGA
jgi:nucleolar protein 53